MDRHINSNESVALTIKAEDEYSPECLIVSSNEVYEFSCDPSQKWTDWFIETNADGFTNWLAILAGLRLKGVKCFKLCGCYNRNEQMLFPIGTYRELTVAHTGKISFFANDAMGFYKNNKGSVTVQVKRIS